MSPEEENTFRVLKDQEPLMTSMWCKFGFHQWTKWNNGEPARNWRGDLRMVQRKTCVHCNDFSERIKEVLTPK